MSATHGVTRCSTKCVIHQYKQMLDKLLVCCSARLSGNNRSDHYKVLKRYALKMAGLLWLSCRATQLHIENTTQNKEPL